MHTYVCVCAHAARLILLLLRCWPFIALRRVAATPLQPFFDRRCCRTENFSRCFSFLHSKPIFRSRVLFFTIFPVAFTLPFFAFKCACIHMYMCACACVWVRASHASTWRQQCTVWPNGGGGGGQMKALCVVTATGINVGDECHSKRCDEMFVRLVLQSTTTYRQQTDINLAVAASLSSCDFGSGSGYGCGCPSISQSAVCRRLCCRWVNGWLLRSADAG